MGEGGGLGLLRGPASTQGIEAVEDRLLQVVCSGARDEILMESVPKHQW